MDKFEQLKNEVHMEYRIAQSVYYGLKKEKEENAPQFSDFNEGYLAALEHLVINNGISNLMRQIDKIEEWDC